MMDEARAELIDVESPPAAIGEALHDMLRLSGSTIKSADHLQDALRASVRHFDPEADRLYFYPQRRRRDEHPNAAVESQTKLEAEAGVSEAKTIVGPYADQHPARMLPCQARRRGDRGFQRGESQRLRIHARLKTRRLILKKFQQAVVAGGSSIILL